MCESGKQCHEGESHGACVDQLKRLIWVLMIWVFVVSLGLGASITFQIIHHQGSNAMNPPNGAARTRSQFTSYDCLDQNKIGHELLWQEKNGEGKHPTIKIEDDGNYFLFLRVTLEDRKQGVNYTVKVSLTTDSNSTRELTEGHIRETHKSTGFLGIRALLTSNTLLTVICSPQAQIDYHKTYLGLIKF